MHVNHACEPYAERSRAVSDHGRGPKLWRGGGGSNAAAHGGRTTGGLRTHGAGGGHRNRNEHGCKKPRSSPNGPKGMSQS